MFPKVLCLLGPTASGKTMLAIQIAQRIACDLISVDSVMVYRGLDIGTAKPDAESLKAYPHELIDICQPTDVFSVAQFREEALRCIASAVSRGRLPVLVGGTMLYHRIVQQGIAALPAADSGLRAELQKKAELFGWSKLHQDLQTIDPQAAQRIHPNDPQRLLRALEVYFLSGKTLSAYWQDQEASHPPYRFINLGLWTERSILRQRVADRFHAMLKQGFLDEVRELRLLPGMHPELPSMKSVGYQQAWQYLAGNLDYDEMIEQAIHATRQLAKRQVTWLRRWPGLQWIDPINVESVFDFLMI